MTEAAGHGFRSGIVVPAHSGSAIRIGILYLGTSEGPERARESFLKHRNLMRAFALELVEWWDAKLREQGREALDLDQLDVDLLRKAQEHATIEEAARDALGEVILRRGSTRRFARGESIGFGHFSTLLDSSLRGIEADFLEPFGALLNSVYLIVLAVEGLRPGAYYLARERRARTSLRICSFTESGCRMPSMSKRGLVGSVETTVTVPTSNTRCSTF